MSTPVPFRKMNGLGNEIVVVDLRGRVGAFTPAAARTIGRRGSPGFDQMMVLHNPETAGTDAYVRIYNADGSEAGACGNGMRCVSWVVAEETGRTSLKFETAAGILEAHVVDAGCVSVDMGAPRFGWRDIPLVQPSGDTAAVEIDVAGALRRHRLRRPDRARTVRAHARGECRHRQCREDARRDI